MKISLKRVFLGSVIGSLCVAAITGIVVFLIGNMGDLEIKVLLTALVIGLFSLTSLCCAALYETKRLTPVAISGMLCSALALVLSLWMIWMWEQSVNDTVTWKATFIAGIVAMSLAHGSLLLLVPSPTALIRHVRSATLTTMSLIVAFLVYLIIMEDMPEFFYRLLGVLAILDALGTILTPLLFKTAHPKSKK